MDNIDYRADELANMVISLNDQYDDLQKKYNVLTDAMKKIADGRGMIPDNSTIYMNGRVPDVPKIFNMYDMREIAMRALKEVS